MNSALDDSDAIANLKKLHSNFVFLPIDWAANNVAMICKRLYALVIWPFSSDVRDIQKDIFEEKPPQNLDFK